MPRSTCVRSRPKSCRLNRALGRVLAEDVRSPVDVPSFDRSNVDGYAVRGGRYVRRQRSCSRGRSVLADETISTGVVANGDDCGWPSDPIATGGMLPRGADAVVMVEHTDVVRRRAPRSAGPSRRARTSRSPAPTSPRANWCCAAARC